MTDKTAAAEEIASMEELIGDLEKRLRRFATTARRERVDASSDSGDFVTAAVERIKNRMREQTADLSRAVAGEASRVGSDALKKVIDDVLSRAVAGEASHIGGNTLTKVIDDAEYQPLLMLALAGGIGYLAGGGRLPGAQEE